ncbi:uncharacterized protein LOC110722263 [Chenopodium quinoa]|uniref:uncharacterized protein LOC110722263 n=1 Tax=Chenopodium quinoa TaxID=63459 RepID=UPI000B7777D3|nr:uncharacterized protein LOC110722263 [Chenopodium quinoa]
MAEETPKSQTPSELMASAKVQVSGAATDVINAAKTYGKPDGDSGVGHYVGKAEDYLHQLHSPSDQPEKAESVVTAEGAEKKAAESVVVAAEGAEKKAAESVVVAAEGAEKKAAESVVVAAEGAEKKAESAAAAAEGGEKNGGVGGLINKAKGLFK